MCSNVLHKWKLTGCRILPLHVYPVNHIKMPLFSDMGLQMRMFNCFRNLNQLLLNKKHLDNLCLVIIHESCHDSIILKLRLDCVTLIEQPPIWFTFMIQLTPYHVPTNPMVGVSWHAWHACLRQIFEIIINGLNIFIPWIGSTDVYLFTGIYHSFLKLNFPVFCKYFSEKRAN